MYAVPVNSKYKTMMCRHYGSSRGCQIGDKCQYAHGAHELRNMADPLPPQAQGTCFLQQATNAPGMVNYKTVKCFYYEKDKYCKYGNACQYAHSDSELKSANEINMLNQIATAINCQMNSNFCEGAYTVNNSYGYDQGQLYGNQNSYYNKAGGEGNYYDYSGTPDTNYGNSEMYGQGGDQYNQYSQYGQYDPNTQYYPQIAYDASQGCYYDMTTGYAYPVVSQETTSTVDANMPTASVTANSDTTTTTITTTTTTTTTTPVTSTQKTKISDNTSSKGIKKEENSSTQAPSKSKKKITIEINSKENN